MVSLPAEPQGKPKNTGVGSLSLLQRIFLTQELNCCYNNLSQTGWHKTDIHSLTVLQKQGAGSVGSLWRLWGGNTVHAALLAFLWKPAVLGVPWLAHVSFPFLPSFFLSVCLSWSLITAPITGSRAHPNPEWYHLQILVQIIYAKTPFPNKVMFTCRHVFWEVTFQLQQCVNIYWKKNFRVLKIYQALWALYV